MPGDLEELEKAQNEREMFKILLEISKLLNTGLDAVSLTYCIRLCENGVNPEGIAKMIIDTRNAVKAYKKQESKGATAKES
ncbi:mitotic-spindle organizing protein 1-like [Rhodnius prolixus]|uniref:Mitotic-spindle organizing gamma-tubulin ring associated n=2 Tax=Rhodnius TaxID=13248 RepID=T1HL21_RHOPR